MLKILNGNQNNKSFINHFKDPIIGEKNSRIEKFLEFKIKELPND